MENPNNNGNTNFKKLTCVVTMVLLSMAIIATAFAFGNDGKSNIETDDSNKQTAVTTTAPQIVTTTLPKITIETLSTTAGTTVAEKKSTTVTTTVKKPVVTTTTTTKKPAQTTKITTTTKKTTTTPKSTTTKKTTTTTKKTTTTTKKTTTTTTTKKTTTTTKKPVVTTTTTTKKPVSNAGNLIAEYKIPGSWNDSVNDFAQIDVSITNKGNSAKSDWVITLTFNRPITVTQSWNCGISANGKTLTIKPWEYNKEIAAGGNTTFGFIVSGNGEISVSSISIK